jgi:hypothetical protein
MGVISKCMENDILTASQSGFIKRDSPVNQLINITNDFGRALDSGKEVRVVFCDISKAFDRAWNSLTSALISFTISFIKK